MIIENIDYSDKYNLVILTIAGEDFSISYDMYNELNVFTDDEIDFDTYKEILKEDSFNQAKNLALSKISYAQKTSFEIKKLLKENDFDTDVIAKVIDFLDEYKLIDDELYVKSYVSDKHKISRWSKNKIAMSLRSKQIADDLIDTYVEEIPADEELAKAIGFAEKKARDDFSNENKQKVMRHLASKGFSYDIISKAISEVFK